MSTQMMTLDGVVSMPVSEVSQLGGPELALIEGGNPLAGIAVRLAWTFFGSAVAGAIVGAGTYWLEQH